MAGFQTGPSNWSRAAGKAREHQVAELATKASALEKAERGTLATLGMSEDDFEPSDFLQGFRAQHRRTLADAQQAPGRDLLNKLLGCHE